MGDAIGTEDGARRLEVPTASLSASYLPARRREVRFRAPPEIVIVTVRGAP